MLGLVLVLVAKGLEGREGTPVLVESKDVLDVSAGVAQARRVLVLRPMGLLVLLLLVQLVKQGSVDLIEVLRLGNVKSV